jgi:hypothetical protein
MFKDALPALRVLLGLGLVLLLATPLGVNALGGPWGLLMSSLCLGAGLVLVSQFLGWRRLPNGQPQQMGVLYGALVVGLVGALLVSIGLSFYGREPARFIPFLILGASAILLGGAALLGRSTLFHNDGSPAPAPPSAIGLGVAGVLGGALGLVGTWLVLGWDSGDPMSALALSQLDSCLQGNCGGLRMQSLSCGEIARVASEVKRSDCMQEGGALGLRLAALLVPTFLLPYALLLRRFPRLADFSNFALMSALILGSGYLGGEVFQRMGCGARAADVGYRAMCITCSGVEGMCGGLR